MFATEEVGIVLTLQTCILEVSGWNLSRVMDCLN